MYHEVVRQALELIPRYFWMLISIFLCFVLAMLSFRMFDSYFWSQKTTLFFGTEFGIKQRTSMNSELGTFAWFASNLAISVPDCLTKVEMAAKQEKFDKHEREAPYIILSRDADEINDLAGYAICIENASNNTDLIIFLTGHSSDERAVGRAILTASTQNVKSVFLSNESIKISKSLYIKENKNKSDQCGVVIENIDKQYREYTKDVQSNISPYDAYMGRKNTDTNHAFFCKNYIRETSEETVFSTEILYIYAHTGEEFAKRDDLKLRNIVTSMGFDES